MPPYPSTIFNPPPKQDGDSVNAAFFNERDAEIHGIEETLGANLAPGGSDPLTDYVKVGGTAPNYYLLLVPEGATVVVGDTVRLSGYAAPAGTKMEWSNGKTSGPDAHTGVRFIVGDNGTLTIMNSLEAGSIIIDPNSSLLLGTSQPDAILIGRTDYNIDTTLRGRVIVLTAAGNIPDALQVKRQDGTSVFTVDTQNSRVGIGAATPQSRLDIGAGAIELEKMSDPGAPSTDRARLYLRYNTTTQKNELVVQFDTGTYKVLATE